jgi:hypothetical protein
MCKTFEKVVWTSVISSPVIAGAVVVINLVAPKKIYSKREVENVELVP